MKLQSSSEMPVSENDHETARCRTRMKKVAAPPPPPLKSTLSRNGKNSHDTPMTTTPGEDCAIDELLEGRMDLDVVLPDSSKIRITVDRRMAMMDLLVHVATANKISAGNHIINVGSKDESSVHYKPNTPIGSLDTNTVYVIPKPVTDLPIRKMPKLANQPFEQTFRLQVNLPSNQRMVLRVSPHRTLAEVKQQICAEKELNHSTHHLVHPSHPETVLDLNSTLEIYGYAEISLMSNSSLRDSIRSTSTNFIAYQRPEEEKRRKGILGLFSRKKKGMSLDTSSNGVNSRGVSPARSEVSVRSSYQPKQSTKRKPAPAPPPAPTGPSPSPPLVIQCSKVESHTESEVSVKADEIGSTVSHSRHSSDSSGYHEPSVFSDCSENKSPDASVVHGSQALTAPESPRPKDQEIHIHKKKSSTPIKETTNLNSVASYSSMSVSSTLRKRKAPQPPVPPPLPEAPKESPTSETTSLVAEVAAIDPSESTEVFEKSPTADDVNSGLSSDYNETDAKHQTEEANDAAVCDATIPASPNPPVSTATQPCSSSCSEASVIPKDRDDGSIVADKAATSTSGQSSSLSEPQGALPSYQNSARTDAAHTGLSSPKEPDYIIQENINCNAQDSIKENAEEKGAGVEQQVVQCNDDTGLKSFTATSHSEVDATMAVLDVIIDEQLQSPHQSSDVSSPVKSDLVECEGKSSPMGKTKETNASSNDTYEVPMLVNSQVLKKTDAKCVDQNSVTVTDETDKQLTEFVFSHENKSSPQQGQTKLPNFTLGCYQTVNEDIYDTDSSGNHVSDIQQVKEYNDQSQNTIKRSDIASDKGDLTMELENSSKPEIPYIQKRKTLDVKITSLKEHKKENSDHFITKGQVQEKRAQFIGLGTQTLGGRSASLHNLTPKKKVVREIMSSEDDAQSSVGGLYRTQSDRNVVQENFEIDEKQVGFIQEQKRLYEEYQKLQAQFISWQKQLINNQSLLQNEQIMPNIVFPTFDGIESNLYGAQNIGENENNKTTSTFPHSETKSDMEELKTRSLPRPKSRPFSLKEESPVRSVSPTQKPTDISEAILKSSIPEAPLTTKSEIFSKSCETQKNTIEDISCKSTEGESLKSPNVPEDKTSQDVIYEEVKSQTLPRPKPKPQATGAFVESRTMTLNRHSRPKSQVVSVTIGSWQQRNEPVTDIDSSSVASVRSKFQSLENIPHGSSKTGVPLPQEPTKASTSAVPEKKSPASKPVVSDKGTDANFKVAETVDKEKHSKYSQKLDATKHVPKIDKVSKSEILSQSRYPKPLIRLTSMKDDFHLPSLRTCNKWPLGEMSQKDSTGPDPLRDELKTSAKAPSGIVREKIHRAEVDLRHHSKKEHKPSSEIHFKHKEVDLRRVSSKSEPGWTQKKYKESDLRQSKSETIPSDSKSTENCSKSESLSRGEPSTSQVSNKGAPAVRPTKLHITTVSIHNSENAQGTTPPEIKSPRTQKLMYGALKYEGTESKLRTLAELKTVLAQKTADKEEANRKMQADETKASSIPVNGSVPPPPPPPTSSMPVIPPAASIPVSSQLVMGKQAKTTATVKQESTSQPKVQESNDPREELMLEIRGFGGRQALRKVPVAEASWHLKVFGPATHSLNSS